MHIKPFSQACENNKYPILQVLKHVFTQQMTVWEIGSGTGQHACFFAQELPHITWQPTDRLENIAGIERWVSEAGLSNVLPPICLDVNVVNWPCTGLDAVFTANTLHIMSWKAVEALFDKLKSRLITGAPYCIYGPFNYDGQYTSDSNAQFDFYLKQRDPFSGIRDIENVIKLADDAGLQFVKDHTMPANNRLLVFRKNHSL